MASPVEFTHDGVPRPSDEMAAARTALAFDRTLMAWMRTSLSLLGFGLTLFKSFEYLETHWNFRLKHAVLGPRGYALILILIGNIALISATIQYLIGRKKLKAAYPGIPPSSSSLVAFLISVFGLFALFVTLFRL